jgi:MoxR-like ATPase
VLPDDVKAVAPDVFRHRLILDFRAENQGLTPEDVISAILNKVELP